ncbi:MAG: hypothetical protein SWQ30_13435 [Thermodesulfobacteriota bacterium]|nr:hypothetical protein [Thermodesulfobacteriota bacterium]
MMKKRQMLISPIVLLLGLWFTPASAQNVQLLYINANIQVALSIKKELKVDKLTPFNALGLHNISEKRKEAYLKKISSSDAVIIVGESGLNAASMVDFPMATIILNAVGRTSAKGPVIRIIDCASVLDKVSGPNVRVVSNLEGVSLCAEDLRANKEVVLKCEGISGVDVANKVLATVVGM